jgi:RNA 2',3'-cyclic 3'-phosphodiesterase
VNGFSGGTSASRERLRLFIAMPVPAEVKRELRKVQAKMRSKLPEADVRWTAPEQFHLTLKFLGNVEAIRVESLVAGTRKACGGFAPVRLHAERIGFFPHAHAPKVIWVWAHDDIGDLIRLQRAIASATEQFSEHEEDRNFTGHLTLGRSRRLKQSESRVLAEMAMEWEGHAMGDWMATTVEIMRSELSSKGTQHSCIAEIPLTGKL